jgi:hypothetical protein
MCFSLALLPFALALFGKLASLGCYSSLCAPEPPSDGGQVQTMVVRFRPSWMSLSKRSTRFGSLNTPRSDLTRRSPSRAGADGATVHAPRGCALLAVFVPAEPTHLEQFMLWLDDRRGAIVGIRVRAIWAASVGERGERSVRHWQMRTNRSVPADPALERAISDR